MPSPNDPVLCCPLPYRVAPVFVQVVSLPLGWSPLSSFLVIWSLSGDTRGSSVVFEAVDMPCPGPFHFSYSVDYMMTCVLSLTQMLVFLYLYVMLSILLSILVCAAASLFCACLVSVKVSAPYVIAGSTPELYTCLFKQMARLLLKISRCLDVVLMWITSHPVCFVLTKGPKLLTSTCPFNTSAYSVHDLWALDYYYFFIYMRTIPKLLNITLLFFCCILT